MCIFIHTYICIHICIYIHICIHVIYTYGGFHFVLVKRSDPPRNIRARYARASFRPHIIGSLSDLNGHTDTNPKTYVSNASGIWYHRNFESNGGINTSFWSHSSTSKTHSRLTKSLPKWKHIHANIF